MRKDFNVKIDEVMVTEGCENDDVIVLGGFSGFLNHFCNFYNFTACYSGDNTKQQIKQFDKMLSDGEKLDRVIDKMINRLDSDEVKQYDQQK